MNTKQLQYALELSKELNFSKVAEKLKITQPALSKQIINLEKELGVKLFERDKMPMQLTYAGKCFMEGAEDLLYKESQLLNVMEQFKTGEQGVLQIGISPFRSLYMLPKVVRKFSSKYPGVQICLREKGSDILRKEVAEGKYDMAIVNLPVDESVLDMIPLEKDTLVLAVPNNLLHLMSKSDGKNMDTIDFAECQKLPFVTVGRSQELRSLLDNLAARAEFHPHIVMEVVGVTTAFAMVQAGIGATLLPLQSMDKEKLNDGITLFSINDNLYLRQPAIVTRRGQYMSEYAEYMIELLRKTY